MEKTRSYSEDIIHIAICDDNSEDRNLYAKKLETLANKFNVTITISHYRNGSSLLFDINDPKIVIDIIFMDINMPDEDGISVSRNIRRMKEDGFNGEIIFLTCDGEHAFEAFDVRAFHYIVKATTTNAKFEEIIRSVILRTQMKNKRQLLLKGIGEYRRIDIDAIHYFEIYKRIVTVYYGNSEQTFEFYSTMEKIEEALLAFRFIRVHRSYLVNLDFVEAIRAQELTLKNSTVIPIGRSYLKKVKELCESISKKS